MTTAILCTVWVLWPLIAVMGGQGYAPLAVTALLVIPVAMNSFRPRLYMAPLVVFFVFAAASAMWSPRPFQLSDISFVELRFNVSSDVTSVALLFAAIAAMMAAATTLDDKARDRVNAFARYALLAHVLIVVVLVVFETPLIKLVYGDRPNDEGVQNISRTSQILSVAAPMLALMLAEKRPGGLGLAMGAVVIAGVAGALAVREVYGGLLALAAAGASIAVVSVFRRSGFRILAIGLALLVLAAPLIFGFLSQNADAALADDTISYRTAIWRRVMDVVIQHPVYGAGVGALREIQEKIPSGVFAGQLLVPNHAHNMMLQLWAETGAIGAGLVAFAVVLAGWRMPPPSQLGRAGWRAAALAGGYAAAFLSFDLWNEWWWAVVGFLAVLTIAHPRGQAAAPPAQESQA